MHIHKTLRRHTLLTSCLLSGCLAAGWGSCSPAGQAADTTTRAQAWAEFASPHDSTRTKVWWFHGETETTREGITADLEGFKRAGVGGVVYYDQVHGEGERALPAFAPEWWDMLRFAAAEARRVGLSFEINLSNGYVAGGPWITKALNMQRLTASDTIIAGGGPVNAVLPRPGKDEYWDVAVLAFPLPADRWETSRSLHPKVTCSLPGLQAEDFFDARRRLPVIPPQREGASVYLTMDFGSPFTARSLSYGVRGRGKATTGAMNVPGKPAEEFYAHGFVKQPDLGQLEVSDDGIHYTKVCDVKPIYSAASGTWYKKTVSFPTVSARYFRLNLHDWCHKGDKRPEMPFGDVILSSHVRTDRWEERAALYSEYILDNQTPAYTGTEIIDPATLIDLTEHMDADGRLTWEAPAGDWVIMRFAHEGTGARSKHGRANLAGLECDKLSAEAVTVHWNHYAKPILDSLAAIGLKPMGVVMDSHEAGSQNWTPGFEKAFRQRRGYDLTRYLPAMMGYIVGSVEETDAFLYDLRRTVADMVSDNYYGTLQRLCSDEGVALTAQATGNGLSLAADNFQAKGRVARPQGEFWGKHEHGSYDMKEASSAAHLYGQRIASAEAYTDAKFSQPLAELKNLADMAYGCQVNEFVVCASAYQPWLDKAPGNTGGGRHYCLNRNNTYWEYSRPFWDYQARCAGLMRKGTPVVDLCIYAGQNAPVKLLTHRLPDIPEGYDFDVCSAEALTTRTTARDGRMALPDGMSYRMLIVQRNNDMPLAVLRHIARLVEGGVPVYAPRPTGSASLRDRADEAEYNRLVDRLWGDTPTESGTRTVGKGTLYWGMTLEEALQQAGIRPDMQITSGNTPTDRVYFAHRRLTDADVYFVNNHSKRAFGDSIRLRTQAASAEFWNPIDGTRYRLPAHSDGQSLGLWLELLPGEAGFIVTGDAADESLAPKPSRRNETIAGTLAGDWQVYFDERKGGPGEVTFASLTDWSSHADAGIRYYSGTAVYRKTVQLTPPADGRRLLLRFERLGDIARVKINGHDAGIVWCSPWEADLTPYVQAGDNLLEIEVTNSLTNRMIGDASLPAEQRYTYAFPEIATPKDRLIPSGIIGEVYIVQQ